jgi:hypothetical protein
MMQINLETANRLLRRWLVLGCLTLTAAAQSLPTIKQKGFTVKVEQVDGPWTSRSP